MNVALFDFSDLLESLSSRFAKKWNMSRRALSNLLKTTFAAGSEDLVAAPRVNCRAVLSVCRPILDRLCVEPAEGWLPWIYASLAAGLFPDPARTPETASQRDAMAFYLQVLSWLLQQEARRCSFDPLTDPHWADPSELQGSALKDEYAAFRKAIANSRFLELLRIGREIMPFDPASHTIGVNNVAVHGARLAKQAGFQVDIPLVSAASLCHDIGKFGCRGKDAARTPYLHYYFTWQWLSDLGLPHIAHVAANHSTWDLEFENLPMESLLLIYADFRVRGVRDAQGREQTSICSLEESYSIIFSKLSDMTPEKRRRYATVYTKLRDFEAFLSSHGVSPDLNQNTLLPVQNKAPALCSGSESIACLRHATFDNSLRLMNTFSTDSSFERLLEQAKGEKNLQRIRTYLLLFEEYNTYMSRQSKRMTLNFLYELLMHREGDVRRRAARIMGRILANSGPSYRKELPADAPATAYAPTLMGYFAEAARLWEEYIELCLHPDRKISAKHAQRIADSLKVITASLFSCCASYDASVMAVSLLRRLHQAVGPERESLANALSFVPLSAIDTQDLPAVIATLTGFTADADVPLLLSVLRCFRHMLEQLPTCRAAIEPILNGLRQDNSPAVEYLRTGLLNQYFGHSLPLPQAEPGELYLSNLKNAVHWTVKLVHIDILMDLVKSNPGQAFHTAMHLSNLLSVSEHLPVREYAGHALLDIASKLTIDQQNEIVVDLTRELETGQEQISYYIPPFLGKMICFLPDKELLESVDFLDGLIHGGTVRAAGAALHTLGAMLHEPLGYTRQVVFERVLSLLMAGIAHFDATLHQIALTVLCRDIFGSEEIPETVRRDCMLQTCKKLLCLLTEPVKEPLTFYNHAAMLNHLYRLIVSCEVGGVPMRFPHPKPVAFFPGTFDPFSTGHKQIVQCIHDLGFEVYLAIDEFSWSKRTIPYLLRRKIASMSVSGLWDVYLFPDNMPINIAVPEDLTSLSEKFLDRTLYLAAGSDVICNASAYHSTAPGSARDYNHVIFRRPGGPNLGETDIAQILRGQWKLLSLPTWCESVSSTRIRDYVDKNLDISMMVDPMVQSFIYENGLYLRSPQFKNVLAPGDFYFKNARACMAPLPPLLQAALDHQPTGYAVLLRARSAPEPLGWVCGHTITSSELLGALGSMEAATYVRQHTSGRIMMVDRAVTLTDQVPDIRRQLVNELLARSLETEHTYALCRCSGGDPLYQELLQVGFLPIPGQPDILCVDMRAPVALIQDVLLWMKEPLRSDPAVLKAVQTTRPRLRTAIASLFPGRLVLSFDAETLNQGLWNKVQAHNQVSDVPPDLKRMGPYMCVPYGKILSDEVVPNTVTKSLHVDKVYHTDLRRFSITEAPGYASLANQVRTLKSFRRPVILVDDLLHRGHRIHGLDHIFKEEQVEIHSIIVGLLSGQGRDLMLTQGRQVDCEYFIPNLHHWITESGLYPFIGGDSIDRPSQQDWSRPSINTILPYVNPTFLPGLDDAARLRLSVAALENAREILSTLERRHLEVFRTALTLGRLAEALFRPRLPDRGSFLRYDKTAPASAYLEEDQIQLRRITMTEVIHGH